MKFILEHDPISQPRVRFSKGRVYDPVSAVKKNLKWEVASQMRQKGYLIHLYGPISIHLIFYTKKPNKLAKRLKNTIFWNFKKPDLDNFVKFYLDVLNKIAYSDDRIISRLSAEKIYGDKPSVEITILPLE